ncbi:hypothetical protein Tco_1532172 [Tanacetum coccineum]
MLDAEGSFSLQILNSNSLTSVGICMPLRRCMNRETSDLLQVTTRNVVNICKKDKGKVAADLINQKRQVAAYLMTTHEITLDVRNDSVVVHSVKPAYGADMEDPRLILLAKGRFLLLQQSTSKPAPRSGAWADTLVSNKSETL